MRPLALLLPPASPTHSSVPALRTCGWAPVRSSVRAAPFPLLERLRPLEATWLRVTRDVLSLRAASASASASHLSSRLLSQEAALEFGSRTALYCTASVFVLFVFVRRRPRRRQQPIRRRTMRPPSQPSQRTARPKRQSRPPTPPPPLSRTRRPPSNARPAAASPIASCASRSQTFASRILSSLLFSLVSRASSVG